MTEPRPLPLRIFVVENHADTLHWLTMYLQDCGHTVGSARNLAEALEALPRANWDVLVSDIGLPDGSGWDLLQKVQLPYPIFGIAISGFGGHADATRSRAAGFRAHLVKPFKMEELNLCLDQAAQFLAESRSGEI